MPLQEVLVWPSPGRSLVQDGRPASAAVPPEPPAPPWPELPPVDCAAVGTNQGSPIPVPVGHWKAPPSLAPPSCSPAFVVPPVETVAEESPPLPEVPPVEGEAPSGVVVPPVDTVAGAEPPDPACAPVQFCRQGSCPTFPQAKLMAPTSRTYLLNDFMPPRYEYTNVQCHSGVVNGVSLVLKCCSSRGCQCDKLQGGLHAYTSVWPAYGRWPRCS